MSIRARIPRRLRVVFQGQRQPNDELQSAGPETPTVELTVFADDSVASGRLALTADRVTDLMNDRAEFEFVDTRLKSIADGHELIVRSVVIRRDEIFAVAVTGPRGDPNRRTRTRPIPIEVRVGHYNVSGNIHVIPGTDPILGFRRRRVMVPLTEATIEYDTHEGRAVNACGTLLVNRELTAWIAPATRADVRPPSTAAELGGPGFDLGFPSRRRVW